MTNFSRGFFEASGEEGFGDGAETEASSVELLGEANRKSAGDFGRSYPVPSQDVRESFGIRVFSRSHSLFFLRKVKALIGSSGPAGPVDFKWAEK